MTKEISIQKAQSCLGTVQEQSTGAFSSWIEQMQMLEELDDQHPTILYMISTLQNVINRFGL